MTAPLASAPAAEPPAENPPAAGPSAAGPPAAALPAADPPAANPPGAVTDAEITAAILRLLEGCGPVKSISPNDVAIALDPAWHPLLGRVRRAAVGLALAGRIHILRKGRPVDPAAARGVIRLRLRPPEDAP